MDWEPVMVERDSMAEAALQRGLTVGKTWRDQEAHCLLAGLWKAEESWHWTTQRHQVWKD